MPFSLLITGGAGFIGSNFVAMAINSGHKVVVVDKLTYAGSVQNLSLVKDHKNFTFVKSDINETQLIRDLLGDHKIDWLVNFAAESHVDSSISDPEEFIKTNICGTYSLLKAANDYYQTVCADNFRFLHVSTDEVFGSLEMQDPAFSEKSPYSPNSPYSASKAASDHLVRAWHKTYGLRTIITNCSNNFGPRQHREKLIPKTIYNAINALDITVYGTGKNIRDWIYVDDHCKGIFLALTKGKVGESYCFGGDYEVDNITLIIKICNILDKLVPAKTGQSYVEQIKYVKDRPGHDMRYAIDNAKAIKELGFFANADFNKSLETTIRWFLQNQIAT